MDKIQYMREESKQLEIKLQFFESYKSRRYAVVKELFYNFEENWSPYESSFAFLWDQKFNNSQSSENTKKRKGELEQEERNFKRINNK